MNSRTTYLLLFVCFVLLSLSTHSIAQDNTGSQSLQSDQLQKIKIKYEQCVFDKGLTIMRYASFKDAIEYAPLACRKLLLQSKKYLLDSAFKVDVINELVASIEEGVKIDLVNVLILELQKDGK